jgi:hypothetical protein
LHCIALHCITLHYIASRSPERATSTSRCGASRRATSGASHSIHDMPFHDAQRPRVRRRFRRLRRARAQVHCADDDDRLGGYARTVLPRRPFRRLRAQAKWDATATTVISAVTRARAVTPPRRRGLSVCFRAVPTKRTSEAQVRRRLRAPKQTLLPSDITSASSMHDARTGRRPRRLRAFLAVTFE